MDDAGAHEKTGAGDPHGEPRFEASEGGIDGGDPKPEIGHPHFILKWRIRPADRGRRLFSEEHVTDKGPKALEPKRKKEQIAQQPVDDEAAHDRPRLPPHRDTGRDKRGHPKQNGHERNLRHRVGTPSPSGQLSRIHRANPSSSTSPAASASMITTASASGTTNSIPLRPRKVTIARNAIRLLPSTKV